MAQLIGVARIGRDAESKTTPSGDSVTEVSLAFSYGKKQDGQRPTQWVKGTIWGERGPKLAPYLTKGSSVYVVLNDAHVETFTKQDGTTAAALVGTVATIEFAGARPADAGQQAPQRAAPQRQAPQQTRQSMAQQAPAGGFADMDDDVPFACLGAGRAWAVI